MSSNSFILMYSMSRDTHGVILVFDITNRKTFENLECWIDEFKEYLQAKTFVMLVGNKSDLAGERKVSVDEAEKFARKYSLKYEETSAKDHERVCEVFEFLLTGKYLLSWNTFI
jgi:small GTP-binding protein